MALRAQYAEQGLWNCRQSVHLSVPAWTYSSKPATAGLLLWAHQAGDIDQLLQQQHANTGSAILLVYVLHRLLNTDWLQLERSVKTEPGPIQYKQPSSDWWFSTDPVLRVTGQTAGTGESYKTWAWLRATRPPTECSCGLCNLHFVHAKAGLHARIVCWHHSLSGGQPGKYDGQCYHVASQRSTHGPVPISIHQDQLWSRIRTDISSNSSHYPGQPALASTQNLSFLTPVSQLRNEGFCWSKVLLPACPCWRQLAHLD